MRLLTDVQSGVVENLKTSASSARLTQPPSSARLTQPLRQGFTVVEWGGMAR